MKILLFQDNMKQVEKSGIGRAIHHQMRALELCGVDYTVDPKDEYDIVHLNMVFPKSFFMARRAKKDKKLIVYHAHSTQEDFRRSFIGSNLISPLFKRWLMICYNKGDLILTPTPYSKRLLKEYGIKKPIADISNGIDLSFYERSDEDGKCFRERYGLSDSDKVIIGVGLYIERKGIVDFVEMAKRMPQYKFIWFGYSNPWTVTYKARKAVKTKLDNLILPGYVPKEQVREAYSGADLFWFPTYEETEGIVMLEALSMKIPVLVRDIPIYESWLLDGVHVYKGKTLVEFSDKIQKVLEQKLPSLVSAGYEAAKERDIHCVAEKLVAQYTSLLKHQAVMEERIPAEAEH